MTANTAYHSLINTYKYEMEKVLVVGLFSGLCDELPRNPPLNSLPKITF